MTTPNFGDEVFYVVEVLADISKLDNDDTAQQMENIIKKYSKSDLVSAIINYFRLSNSKAFISIYYLPFHKSKEIR